MTSLKLTAPVATLTLGKLEAERRKLEARVDSAINEFLQATGIQVRVTADVHTATNMSGSRQLIRVPVVTEVMLP